MMKPRHLIIVPALLVLVILAAVTAPLLAQSGNSWYVVYYSDPNWSVPTAGQYTSYIAFDWGTGAPSPGMPSTNWTANMTTTAYFSAGNYTFSALADDEISMQIDGVTYINTMGAGMAGKPVSLILPMTEGYHNIAVWYRQYTGEAYVYLTWAYGSVTPAPTGTPSCDPWWSCSCPVQATTLTTRYGDYTNCIQQNIHQSNCFVSDGQWDSPNMELDSVGAADPGVGRALHTGSASVYAVGVQPGARGGHVFEDRGGLVLLRSVPGADADPDPVRLLMPMRPPPGCGRRMGCEPEISIGLMKWLGEQRIDPEASSGSSGVVMGEIG